MVALWWRNLLGNY